MNRLMITFTAAVVTLSMHPGTTLAVNKVTVGSVTVSPGQTGVTIPIKIENDVPLSVLIVPLIIREVSGGADITSLQLQWSERVASAGPPLSANTYIRQVNGSCGVDGLGTILFNDENSHPASSPVGVDMSWIALWTSLPAGADVSGSLLLTLDVALPEGVFEIDVTCGDPANVLVFVDEFVNTITPTFQKGTITVCPNYPGDANSDGVVSWNDLIYLSSFLQPLGPAPDPLGNGDPNGDCLINQDDVDYLAFHIIGGGPAPVACTCDEPIVELPSCCDTPGDANDNGSTNIADAIYIINRVFGSPAGPAPPCCEEGDANGNGSVNIADAIYIINRVFGVPVGPAPICGPAGMGC